MSDLDITPIEPTPGGSPLRSAGGPARRQLVAIPVGREASQVRTVTLDGRSYQLEIEWVQRLGQWVFSLRTGAGALLVGSKALTVGSDLLRQVRHDPRVPLGALGVLDTQTPPRDPAWGDWGDRHVLLYEAEV